MMRKIAYRRNAGPAGRRRGCLYTRIPIYQVYVCFVGRHFSLFVPFSFFFLFSFVPFFLRSYVSAESGDGPKTSRALKKRQVTLDVSGMVSLGRGSRIRRQICRTRSCHRVTASTETRHQKARMTVKNTFQICQ